MGFNNGLNDHKSYKFMVATIAVAAFTTSLIIALSGIIAHSSYAASVKQVSTGSGSACAVVDGNAKCWGANDFGQLGNGNTATSTNPVQVSKQAGVMDGKYVEKVSVGVTHACALADAQVYCWGDNSHGQLGNHSTANSSVPVTVATNGTAKSSTETVCTAYFLSWCTASKQVTTTKPISSLANKEIVDISAGELFTCALASDGTVACWGEGDNGRLGTNSNSDNNYPQSIYNATGSTFYGKIGVKLAKAAGATMCVIAKEGSAGSTATGSAYCWGYGIDNGTGLPSNGSSTVACSKNSTTSKPSTTSPLVTSYIFESNKPVNVPNATFASIDGSDDYVTGFSTDGRAYYWGMYGYTETANVSNITTCSVNPCTSMNTARITLALTSTQKKAKAANQGGGDKKTNLNGGNKATTGGVSSSVSGSSSYGVTHTTGGTYSTIGSRYQIVGNPDTGYQTSTFTQNNYQGVATPNGNYSAPSVSNVGNNKNSSNCASQLHYGYTKNATYAYTGQKVAATPPAWSSSRSGFTSVSGNVFNGLFCAANGTVVSCDAHGTSVNEGQTGSNYTRKCITTGFIFTTTTCEATPTGPQQVISDGWLAGKTITSLSTGTSGYTCALANGSVGCWGINNYGQLGNGTNTDKKVPTSVNL